MGNENCIQACYLNTKLITKDKLVRWLKTVCFKLDLFSVPLLQNAVPLVNRVAELQEEKIEAKPGFLNCNMH
jgi:hypothetical protein